MVDRSVKCHELFSPSLVENFNRCNNFPMIELIPLKATNIVARLEVNVKHFQKAFSFVLSVTMKNEQEN